MCGIVGQFNFLRGQWVNAETIRRMSVLVNHRGPDSSGEYCQGQVGMGVRRLAIIDVEGGDQPIWNEDGTVVLTCNGEIYNAPELTRELEARGHRFRTSSDVEVILHLYEEYGENCPIHLNGMFAFALWDERSRRLLLARDTFGIKPLYYHIGAKEIVWASELKALLAAGVEARMDPIAIWDYLSYWYVPEPGTPIQDVRKLPPGHVLVVDGAGVHLRQFRDLPVPGAHRMALGESCELVWRSLRNAVSRHLRSDVPAGVLLSGGIDSSLVAMLAKEAGAELQAYTVDFDIPSYSEADQARKTARSLGFPLRVIPLTAAEVQEEIEQILDLLDDPFGDFSIIPCAFLYREARKEVVVALSGDGGDELFAGYQTHFVHKYNRVFSRLPRIMQAGLRSLLPLVPDSRKYLSPAFRARAFLQGAGLEPERAHYAWKLIFSDEEKARLLSPEVRDACLGWDSFRHMEELFRRCADFPDLVNRFLYVDARSFLLCDNLVKVDRVSMAHSLEVRVPFLDLEVAEAAARIPVEHKLNGTKTKFILRQLLGTRLPREIADGPKRGFTPPLARWMEQSLMEFVGDHLSPETLRAVPILNAEAVGRLWHEHFTRTRDWHRQLWALVVLVRWYRRYITGGAHGLREQVAGGPCLTEERSR